MEVGRRRMRLDVSLGPLASRNRDDQVTGLAPGSASLHLGTEEGNEVM